MGSDHCPVWAALDVPAPQLPQGFLAPALSTSHTHAGAAVLVLLQHCLLRPVLELLLHQAMQQKCEKTKTVWHCLHQHVLLVLAAIQSLQNSVRSRPSKEHMLDISATVHCDHHHCQGQSQGMMFGEGTVVLYNADCTLTVQGKHIQSQAGSAIP